MKSYIIYKIYFLVLIITLSICFSESNNQKKQKPTNEVNTYKSPINSASPPLIKKNINTKTLINNNTTEEKIDANLIDEKPRPPKPLPSPKGYIKGKENTNSLREKNLKQKILKILII